MQDKKKRKVRKNGIKRAKNAKIIIEKKRSMTEREKENGVIDQTAIRIAIYLKLKTGKKKKETILNAEIEMKDETIINLDIDQDLVLDQIQKIDIEAIILTKNDPNLPFQ